MRPEPLQTNGGSGGNVDAGNLRSPDNIQIRNTPINPAGNIGGRSDNVSPSATQEGILNYGAEWDYFKAGNIGTQGVAGYATIPSLDVLHERLFPEKYQAPLKGEEIYDLALLDGLLPEAPVAELAALGPSTAIAQATSPIQPRPVRLSAPPAPTAPAASRPPTGNGPGIITTRKI